LGKFISSEFICLQDIGEARYGGGMETNRDFNAQRISVSHSYGGLPFLSQFLKK